MGLPPLRRSILTIANKLWGYNSAVNRDFLELSPGWVLLAHQIRWACEHGRTELDFMRGDEAYKYRFGAVDRHVVARPLDALVAPCWQRQPSEYTDRNLNSGDRT